MQLTTAVFRVVVVALVLLSGACAGTRSTGAIAETRARVVTLGVVDGALLTRLPPGATFAWVDPTTIFTDIEPADGAHSMESAFEGLRYAATAVLLANDWGATTPEQAQFQLAVAVVDRPVTLVRYRADPRNERTPLPVCHVDARTKQRICRTPSAPNHPPIRSSVASIERRIGYVIRRMSDGATRWWILNNTSSAEAEQLITRRTLELLLVEDP